MMRPTAFRLLGVSSTLGTKASPFMRSHVRCSSSTTPPEDFDELAFLEKLLASAKARAAMSSTSVAPRVAGPKFNIGTFNKISPLGLQKFSARYNIVEMTKRKDEDIHAILLRSHKLQSSEVPESVRAIARCGSGTNNIPVAEMTERGIPVFNTPGANANSVKELTICGMLLASRGVVQGINHLKNLWEEEKHSASAVSKRVEKDKSMFVGQELLGKTVGVVGLGHIGASVAEAAIHLGMKVVGYDPAITVQTAWRLPGDKMARATTLEQLLQTSDYICLHVPYMKETHHMISADALAKMKPTCHLINFARGELVDTTALRKLYDSGLFKGNYVADFADEQLHDHPNVIQVPHLGASTEEAESNAAAMAADGIQEFVETGAIRNSVNFPTTELTNKYLKEGARLCIVNKNIPGVLGRITGFLGELGLNIQSTINTSKGNIAYNVVDLNKMPDNVGEMQDKLSALEGVISSRLIDPSLKVGWYRKTDKK